MTFPSDGPALHPASMPPQKLSWVTVPLVLMMVLQALGVLLLPLLVPLLHYVAGSPSALQNGGTSPADVGAVLRLLSASVWVIEVLQVASLVWSFLTLRAVQAGRNWGRTSAVVLFVLGLLNIPIGTLLGVFGLIGAFDPEVTRYCSR